MRGLFGLRCATLFGGADKAGQAARLGPPAPHLLVATPGRLLDMLDDGNTTLGETSSRPFRNAGGNRPSLCCPCVLCKCRGFRRAVSLSYEMHGEGSRMMTVISAK